MVKRFRTADFWHLNSAESLCRTCIDLVLFDRLSAHQESIAARNLSLLAERSIVTQTLDPSVVVSGDADYILGYTPAPRIGHKFESSSVVIEAKKSLTFGAGLAQVTAYLGMSFRTRRVGIS
jgi:hypothetical protein